MNDDEFFNHYKFNHEGEHASLSMDGIRYKGPGRAIDEPILDTYVKGTLKLCITWTDKEKFINELDALLLKYRI